MNTKTKLDFNLGDTVQTYTYNTRLTKSKKKEKGIIVNMYTNKSYALVWTFNSFLIKVPKSFIIKIITKNTNNRKRYYKKLNKNSPVIVLSYLHILQFVKGDRYFRYKYIQNHNFMGKIIKKVDSNIYSVQYYDDNTKSMLTRNLFRYQIRSLQDITNSQKLKYKVLRHSNILKELEITTTLPKTDEKCRNSQWDLEEKCYLDPVMYDCVTENDYMSPSKNCYTKFST